MDMPDMPSEGIWRWERRVYPQKISSYGEVSPSGTGVKVYLLAEQVPRLTANKLVIHPANGTGKAQQIEVYTTERFFCVTGQHLDGTPDEICDTTEAFTRLAAKVAREGGSKADGRKASKGSGHASLD